MCAKKGRRKRIQKKRAPDHMIDHSNKGDTLDGVPMIEFGSGRKWQWSSLLSLEEPNFRPTAPARLSNVEEIRQLAPIIPKPAQFDIFISICKLFKEENIRPMCAVLGEPSTGKSTGVREICRFLDVDLYMINGQTVREDIDLLSKRKAEGLHKWLAKDTPRKRLLGPYYNNSIQFSNKYI